MGVWRKAKRRWSGWSLPTRLGLGIGGIGVCVSLSAWIWPNFWNTQDQQESRLAVSSGLAQMNAPAEAKRPKTVPLITPYEHSGSRKPTNARKNSSSSASSKPTLPPTANLADVASASPRTDATPLGGNFSAESTIGSAQKKAGGTETAAPTFEPKPLAEQKSPNLLRHTTGTVKWFNAAKGYGFITDASGRDVFVHFSEIAEPGYRSLEDGTVVEFDVITGPKGIQAHKVKMVSAKGQK